MRKIFLFILIAFLLTGCGTKEEPSDTKEPTDIPKQENTEKENKQDDLIKEPSGYSFEYNNVSIYMNTDVAPVIEALGEPCIILKLKAVHLKG